MRTYEVSYFTPIELTPTAYNVLTGVMHATGSPNRQLIAPKLTRKLNAIDAFTFTITPSNPAWGSIELMNTKIKVTRNGKTIFIGRPLSYESKANGNRSYTCEGALGFLHDRSALSLPEGSPTRTRYDMFKGLIDNYNYNYGNAFNDTVAQWVEMGDVSQKIKDGKKYSFTSDWTKSTYEELIDHTINLVEGSYLWLSYDESSWMTTVNWVADFDRKNAQVVELGVNIRDYAETTDGSGLVDAIRPIGKDGLMIPSGQPYESGDYIVDDVGCVGHHDAIAKFGFFVKTVKYDDITTVNGLIAAAKRDIAATLGVTLSRTVKVVDLNLVDGDEDLIDYGQYIRTIVPTLGVDELILITEIEEYLASPKNNTITLGTDSRSTSSGSSGSANQALSQIKGGSGPTSAELASIKATADDAQAAATVAQKTASEALTMVENQDDGLSVIAAKLDTVSTALAQYVEDDEGRPDAIITQVDELRAQLTAFEQNYEGFRFGFTDYRETQETVNGQTETRFEMLDKYIRFDDGAIILGQSDSDFTLKITNDHIGFMQAGAEVAYISDNRLYINDGSFLESLRIGDFAFVPRANGSLTFAKL